MATGTATLVTGITGLSVFDDAGVSLTAAQATTLLATNNGANVRNNGDATYIGNVSIPADFSAMTAVQYELEVASIINFVDDTCELRTVVRNQADTLTYAGIVIIAEHTDGTGVKTANATLTSQGLAATKAEWETARVELQWQYAQSMSNDSGRMFIDYYQLNITYTATAPPGGIAAHSRNRLTYLRY